MKTKNDILNILRLAKPSLQARYPIGDIGIFGSRMRDDFHDASDIDILVDIQAPMAFEFMQLAYDLEEIFDEKIDLIARSSMRQKALDYIAKDLVYV